MLYPYRFIRSETNIPDYEEIIRRYYYRFVSPLTNKEYRVFIDHCQGNIYIIKFYLKQDEKRKNRYNVLSGLNEPRNVVFTCLDLLMNEFLDKDDTASFGFIASNIPGEGIDNTKRFRFYRQMMANLIGEKRFTHYFIREESVYLLVPTILGSEQSQVLDSFQKMMEQYDFVDVE